MQATNGAYWTTDEELFLACQGGRAVADWFGFVPSFHDATLDRIELAGGNALLAFKTFRMTDEVDAEGFFLLDRHAVVTGRLTGVTGVALNGDASSTLLEVGVRRVAVEQIGWATVNGPKVGDIELALESSMGLEGSIFARSLRFDLEAAHA